VIEMRTIKLTRQYKNHAKGTELFVSDRFAAALEKLGVIDPVEFPIKDIIAAAEDLHAASEKKKKAKSSKSKK